eukprot:5083476-Amphidinium_carterae.3
MVTVELAESLVSRRLSTRNTAHAKCTPLCYVGALSTTQMHIVLSNVRSTCSLVRRAARELVCDQVINDLTKNQPTGLQASAWHSHLLLRVHAFRVLLQSRTHLSAACCTLPCRLHSE